MQEVLLLFDILKKKKRRKKKTLAKMQKYVMNIIMNLNWNIAIAEKLNNKNDIQIIST